MLSNFVLISQHLKNIICVPFHRTFSMHILRNQIGKNAISSKAVILLVFAVVGRWRPGKTVSNGCNRAESKNMHTKAISKCLGTDHATDAHQMETMNPIRSVDVKRANRREEMCLHWIFNLCLFACQIEPFYVDKHSHTLFSISTVTSLFVSSKLDYCCCVVLDLKLSSSVEKIEWNCVTLATNKTLNLCLRLLFPFRTPFPLFYLDSVCSWCHQRSISYAVLHSFLNVYAPFDIKCSKQCANALVMHWPWCTI